jgi:hypothetical protein
MGLGAAALLTAAIVRELRQPSDQRQWHGRLLGIPYELRPPTAHRLRKRLWNTHSSHIIKPTPFGLGWTVNLAAALRALRVKGAEGLPIPG